MNLDFLKIVINSIDGIKSPKFTLAGNKSRCDIEFELYVDGKKQKFTYKDTIEGFSIEKELNNADNLIEVFVLYDGKKTLVSKKVNSKWGRIRSKFLTYLKFAFHLIKRIYFLIARTIKKALIYVRNVFKLLFLAIKVAWLRHHFLIPFSMWQNYSKKFKEKLESCFIDSPYYFPFNKRHYNMWLKKQSPVVYKKLTYKPLISIIIPVYNIDGYLLEDCLNSVLNQSYENFEVCIADDCSTKEETINTLKKYEKLDDRIKVIYREKNGHISEASNSAIGIASGEFIAFLDDDDLLTPDALYQVALCLNEDKKIDMIYTDEDKMDVDGKLCEPFFKPDFSPDTLLSFNYITHFAVYRKSLVEEIGLLRSEYNGAQDFDFVLRFTEKTDKIKHISKITYHWRKVEGSTALKMDSKNYALEAGKKAIEDALRRRNIKGDVFIPTPMAHYIVKYKYEREPMISIIIPTRDYADTLETCLKSIYEKTLYKNFEIIIMNNQSVEEKTFDLFKTYSKYDNFKVIDADMEFNYSKINNLGVKNAKGEYIVLLNNDTEIISPDWLSNMVGYAMQSHIGAVGAKLIYPDNTLQHCGVVLGIAHTAGHFGVGTSRFDNGFYARYMVPYDNGAVTAACLMVKKSKFLEVNGLDEELSVAFNDVEFNIKLLKKGYYNVCLPQVMLYHYESKSRGMDTKGEKYKRFLKESDLLRKKGGNYIKRDPFYNDNLSIYYPMMLPIEKEK